MGNFTMEQEANIKQNPKSLRKILEKHQVGISKEDRWASLWQFRSDVYLKNWYEQTKEIKYKEILTEKDYEEGYDWRRGLFHESLWDHIDDEYLIKIRPALGKSIREDAH